MNTIRQTINLAIIVLLTTTCSTFTPKPTETPLSTATSSPTLTSTPNPTITPTETLTATPTRKPTKTSKPATETASVPVLSMPSGKPVENWEGIPIMPFALAGESNNDTYVFTIKFSTDGIQKFYANEMARLGWEVLASGQSPNGAMLMIFQKGVEMVTLSIIPQPNEVMYVMIVK